MAKIIGFRRQFRKRRAKPPWLRLVAPALAAAALWLAAELHPDGASDRRGFTLLRGGTATNGGRLVTTSGGGAPTSAHFVLCAGAQRANCVIDGDTIRMGDIKIRLEDIDAPEVFSPKCPSELARGKRATARLLELINAGPFEVVRTGARDQDRYGRQLRTLVRAGRSLGAVLVAEGLARPWDGARRSWCG